VALLALAFSLAACGGEATVAPRPAPVLPAATEIAAVLGAGWDVRVAAPETAGVAADVALAPDGSAYAVAGLDGSVHVALPGQGARVEQGHAARALSVAISPDGRAVASASADASVRILSPGALQAPGEQDVVVLGGHGAPVVDVAWTGDGRHVVTNAVDGTARVFSAEGALRATLGDSRAPVDRLALVPSGGLLVAASRSRGTLRIADLDGGAVARFEGLGESAERFAISPSAVLVVVGGTDGRLVSWSSDARSDLAPHAAAVQDVAFASDGSRFATASLDGTARVHSADGAELLRLGEHGAPLHRVALLPGAARVLTVGADRRAVLWSDQGDVVAEIDSVTDAAFVAGGRAVLAWSGADPAQAVTVHGEPLACPPGAERGIVRLVVSDEGDAFAWLAPDRTVRIALGGSVGPPAEPAQEHPAAAYAHPEWCARCHRPEYDRWVNSSHAWTSTLASPASLPRDVVRGREIHHAPGVTRFGEDDDGWYAETLGGEGEPQRFRLTHVAGHKRMKMLLATLDDGRIQVLPAMVEWPGGPWFDYTHLLYGSPDQDLDTPPIVQPGEASFWTGAVRSWDQKCAVCHTSGRLPREPDADGRGPRSVWRSLGVDCETCHGPGRAHAEAWERGETGAPLLRLEALGRDAAVAVCTQCHMEGDRVTASYEIGADLYEHLDPTLALSADRADPYGRPLELIYDGLPFGTSHCAERGGLTCSRCHEPHGSELDSQLRLPAASGEFCGGCHDDVADEGRDHTAHDPRGSGGSCVACHMPFLTIERGHGAVADHTIGVPRLDLPGDRVAMDACTWCHSGERNAPTDAPRIGGEALRDAYARWWPDAAPPRPWMRAVAAARAGDPSVGGDLLDVVRDATEPRLVRATALRLLEPYGASHVDALLALASDADSLLRRSVPLALRGLRGPRIDEALREALGDPSAAVRVNAARASLFGWERARQNRALLLAAIPVLEEDVGRVPDDYFRWYLLGAARGLAGDDKGALAAYERVLVLDPLAHAVRAHVERLRTRLSTPR
jgi:predicted CXXCH cytochrome family protein